MAWWVWLLVGIGCWLGVSLLGIAAFFISGIYLRANARRRSTGADYSAAESRQQRLSPGPSEPGD